MASRLGLTSWLGLPAAIFTGLKLRLEAPTISKPVLKRLLGDACLGGGFGLTLGDVPNDKNQKHSRNRYQTEANRGENDSHSVANYFSL